MSESVFLVPRRKDGGHRDEVWEYAARRWRKYMPDVPIVEGHHNDGPFNRSAAINTAAEQAGDWDFGIVIDSDVMLSISQVRAAIATAKRTGKVTWGHRRWRGIREDATKRIIGDRFNSDLDFAAELDRDKLDLIVERTNPLSWSCCFVMPRAVFDDMGGFDERFRGWGFEDMAFQSVIAGLYGHERIEGDVIHLWHPRSEERIIVGESRDTASPEYVVNARLGRRYMVALRRDHALHDRGDLPASEAERQRDIENLKRDDAKYDRVAHRLGLPDWHDWWPTLRELVEGAKQARGLASEAPITVILRTGGEPETWDERSAYLKQSITSLDEQVRGPIVQRVIYSDWGPEHLEELRAIGEPYGFYVAGPERHLGYVGAVQALWRYIDKRAVGTFVFLTEDDFLYQRPVDLTELASILGKDRSLRQIALLRNACYPRELESDGILGWPPESFEKIGNNGTTFLAHRLFFTMNPSLIHRSLVATPWPRSQGNVGSERIFGDLLLRDQRTRFAFWGDGEPWVTHIGEVRASSAY